MGKQWKQWQSIFLCSKITADGDHSHEIFKKLFLGRKSMADLDSLLKNRDITFPTKVNIMKAMFLPGSHVWMWELEHKEGSAPKNRCFWTVVLEKTPESLWDCKEIKSVNPKVNQSWIFIWRTDADAKAPIIWPFDEKNWFTGKDPHAAKYWR